MKTLTGVVSLSSPAVLKVLMISVYLDFRRWHLKHGSGRRSRQRGSDFVLLLRTVSFIVEMKTKLQVDLIYRTELGVVCMFFPSRFLRIPLAIALDSTLNSQRTPATTGNT